MSLDSLISQIRKDKMNEICFDCGAQNPVFVSINNGIFLCSQCATVHMSFQPGVSTVENNDLYSLSVNELNFLVNGGNTRLNDFILDEFPKLENYSQKLLYKTRAMDYYRKRLNYLVNGGVEPTRPSQIAGCQLIPDNFYTQNNYTRNAPQKVEPKTKTYRPYQNFKAKQYNVNPKSIEDDYNEDNFFNNPFLNDDKFGMNEGNMFKKFFGDDFGFNDDDFFTGRKNKRNQTQMCKEPPVFKVQRQSQPQVVFNNVRQPQDNLSKKKYSQVYTSQPQQQPTKRPLTSTNPIFVPSRKHKYIKREDQNNNNTNNYNNNTIYNSANTNTNTNSNNYNRTNYNNNNNTTSYCSANYNDNNNNNNTNQNQNVVRNAMETPNQFSKVNNNNYPDKDRYNPFKRRDSTELITLPNVENSNLSKNKKDQKKQEIPLEFHRQATGLGQIADAVSENDEDSISEKSEKSEKSKKDSDYEAELKKIPENNTHTNKDIFDESQITFKNSIRNKYKKRKSEQIMENLKNEEKAKNPNTRGNYNTNNNVYESRYSKNSNSNSNTNSGKKDNDSNNNYNYTKKPSNKIENNAQFDKRYARRLSKIKITSTNWNINQLGDKNIYPDAIEVEE